MGIGWVKGRPRSEETKLKISLSTKGRRGKPLSEETRRKISKAQKGQTRKPLKEETKKKIGDANRGRKHTAIAKQKMSQSRTGKKSNNKGKTFSEEARKHMSDAAKGKHLGENNGNWRGGVTKHYAYKRWKSRAYQIRKNNVDGFFTHNEWETLKAQYAYTCPMCKRKEPDIKLTADHVIPISKGGCNNICNIQPLCRSCNSKKQTKIYRISSNGELMLF